MRVVRPRVRVRRAAGVGRDVAVAGRRARRRARAAARASAARRAATQVMHAPLPRCVLHVALRREPRAAPHAAAAPAPHAPPQHALSHAVLNRAAAYASQMHAYAP